MSVRECSDRLAPAMSCASTPDSVAAQETPRLAASRHHRRSPADAPRLHLRQAQACSIILPLQDIASRKFWQGSKRVRAECHVQGTLALTSLRQWQGTRAPVPAAPPQALPPSLDRSDPDDGVFLAHLALVIAAHLARHCDLPGTQPPQREATQRALSGHQAIRLEEYVNSHLTQALTLAALADHCGMSRSTFARAFKLRTGTTPFSWIRAQRVKRAKSLLDKTDLPLAAISAECGFADQGHFSRVFSQSLGISPARWRKENRCRSSTCGPPARCHHGFGYLGCLICTTKN